MTYVVGLVALLLLLAGVIAYAGDRLGTWVGRRRLTLFGARPRRTGQIVGVAAGIVIMLTTLGVLALAFRNATQTLLNAQRTAQQLTELQGQERALQRELSDLLAQQAALEADLDAARETIGEAESARDAALSERDGLRAEAEATRAQLLELGDQLASAREDLDDVEAALAQARAERDGAVAEVAAARQEIVALETEVTQVEAALLVADTRLLERDVQLAEADAALAAADELRLASEAAALEAIAAAAAAEAAQAVAVSELEEAEADLAAAEAARAEAVAEREQAVLEREAAQAQVDDLNRRIDQLVAQAAALSAEASSLEALAQRLTAEAEALERENVGLQARNDQLAESNAELLSRSSALQELNASLQSEILSGNEEVRALQDQVVGLNDRLEEQARRLAELQQEFARAASGEVTFARDQVIYSGALYAADAAEARDELAAFVREASAHTARLGAGDVVLTAEQFAGLVEVISETEGSDLVRFISPRNQFNPARVEVMIEALENTRLFEAGQLLMSRRVHLGTAELPATLDEVRGWIAQFRADIIRTLRRSGLDELQAPVFVGSSDEAFANQLMRLEGAAVIGVVAREPIERAGPAYVEFVILY
ncbi:MAG: DUF3084 domain-containing protein [Trueperaceae bacterium]